MFYCYLSGGGEWNRLERRTRRAGNGKKKKRWQLEFRVWSQ